MAKEFVLTKTGKAQLEEQLEYLKTVKWSEISEQIKVARSFGDLSENAEYTEARNEQSRIEGKILELEAQLKAAVVVDDDQVDLNVVSIGTRVKLLDMEFNEEETYQILGSSEADIFKNNISNESPVGQALLGHKVGEVVTIDAEGGSFTYKILEITKAERD